MSDVIYCACGHDWADHLYGGPCLADEIVDRHHADHHAIDPDEVHQEHCACLRFDDAEAEQVAA